MNIIWLVLFHFVTISNVIIIPQDQSYFLILCRYSRRDFVEPRFALNKLVIMTHGKVSKYTKHS